MTQGKLTIKIDEKVTEQNLIENCLMYKHSGYEYLLTLSLYALAEKWNFNKLSYYLNLIEEVSNE
jgi:hypothetical protein